LFFWEEEPTINLCNKSFQKKLWLDFETRQLMRRKLA
jgi:hypothetical protein